MILDGNNIPPKDTKEPQILVVEDSVDALCATASLLELLGWHPLTAEDGSQALHLAEATIPAFALIDLNLPDIDGYTLSEELTRINPNIKIYISSGTEFDQQRSLPTIVGQLLKPVSLTQLDELLSEHVR